MLKISKSGRLDLLWSITSALQHLLSEKTHSSFHRLQQSDVVVLWASSCAAEFRSVVMSKGGLFLILRPLSCLKEATHRERGEEVEYVRGGVRNNTVYSLGR